MLLSPCLLPASHPPSPPQQKMLGSPWGDRHVPCAFLGPWSMSVSKRVENLSLVALNILTGREGAQQDKHRK